MGSPLGFLYRQATFKPKPLPETVKLTGKTAIVTGANVGLGLEASREMAQHGLTRIILAVRSISKGEAARKEILNVAPSCDIQVWELDYETATSITTFAERAQTLDRLDIVILCAGVKSLEFELSKTGHETNVQVNHLGTSLLSLLLLPALTKSAKRTGSPSRMTIVSSEVHFWTPFNERKSSSILVRLDEKDSFKGRGLERYNTSKLLNVLWTRELVNYVNRDEVLINCVNPSLCATQLHRTERSFNALVMNSIAWTAEQGGRTLTDAATQHAGHQGAYISCQEPTSPSKFVLSKEGQTTQRRIWDETIAEFAKTVPGFDITVLLPER